MPEQRLSREEALTAYTSGAAYAAFMDADTGTLMPGKWADLVVLRDDLFALSPSRLHDNQVMLTVVGGRIVHQQRM